MKPWLITGAIILVVIVIVLRCWPIWRDFS